ncbi:DUF2306 domain-containing protein [Dankookia sp. P2]|uniref:DUF2306 domain-containing protein n=1 Tax=Dankookia sp. P2 TaxID=3423955 RepID=UPI003D67DFDE
MQLHAAAGLAAFALGTWQIAAPKGTRTHRRLGLAWLALMLALALSSLGITGRWGAGHLSWIHGLSFFVLALLPAALVHARRGRIAAHRRLMLALFFGALVVTGAFTLTPGRLMARIVFS